MSDAADVIVVGAGLAGLVATYELSRAGRRVLVVEQENEANLGGQAHWAQGGLLLVNSPEQRRLCIKDSLELALSDWLGSAGFDRDREDRWTRAWAESYLGFAAGGKRDYLRGLGLTLMPNVGWPERGAGTATGPGNSVPRFHVTWGSGPEVVRVFRDPVLDAAARGLVSFKHRHRVDEIVVEGGAAVGVRGALLAPSDAPRGASSTRREVGTFDLRAQAVVVTSGGIGGNLDLVRENWPTGRLGSFPESILVGVPAHVDGRMLGITARAGGSVVNLDRMWHYPEGLKHHSPTWPRHAVHFLPGPSALWLDPAGRRLPPPLFPGQTSGNALRHLASRGHTHSWLIMTQTMVDKEFDLSGSAENPDITGKNCALLLLRAKKSLMKSVRDFLERGEDIVAHRTLPALVEAMNALTPETPLDLARVEHEAATRDLQVRNDYSKDLQLMSLHNVREYKAERLLHTARPHRLLDPEHGPLYAIRLNLFTRKSLGGVQTTLDSQVVRPDGSVIDGLYAAGEAAGFGGGGMHGYHALEGSFLGGCIFSGRVAGRALDRELS
ncbi:FAD-binding dehydrogenase [Amycolatopsis coloradensis]|uniref:FAD-binding dehydrogenase n=1 Tax=Amycolatopsis coloradensis TaxID=76021 RepID=A0A1R0KFL7_9PSEU|nr:FAD-binding dehydrogenase [Amycolatopsis coloradensis]OLZ44153.1 FAD-binding dehydrogenase [Amycolatopsis coloradensis]